MQTVYVITMPTGHVKIGISGSPLKRLRTLQTGCPLPLRIVFLMGVPDRLAIKIERAAHKALADYRLNGEWFKVTTEKAISAVRRAAGIEGIEIDHNAVQEPIEDEEAMQAIQEHTDRARARAMMRERIKAKPEPKYLRRYEIRCKCGHSAKLALKPADAVSRRFRCSRCGAAAAPIL
ncbi:hypothetical protein [Microcystis phage Mwe-JY08]